MALVHRWKFENDLNDSVGSSNGSNTNCTFYPNNNINGNYSVYIPKTPTGYPTFPSINISSYTNFTWAFWFRSVLSGVEQFLVFDWTYPPYPDERLSFLLMNNNKLRVLPYVGGSFYPLDSTTSFNISAWNHVVLTASGSGSTAYTIYLNGKYDIAGTKPRSSLATNTFRLGVHSPGVTAAKFDGYMDDFRFYDTALTADEVMNLYKSYATPIWQQPLHHWKLDGDATDSAGSRNGTATNVTYEQSTKISGNYSGYFNGSSVINCGDWSFFSYTNISISLWIKATGTNDALLTCTRPGYNIPRVQFILDSAGYLNYTVVNNSGSILFSQGGPPCNDGVWHHIVIVDANGTVTSYLDGSSTTIAGSYSRSNLSNLTTVNMGIMVIATNERPFAGLMDDVRFYDVALSAADVRALYNSYFTEKASNFMSIL